MHLCFQLDSCGLNQISKFIVKRLLGVEIELLDCFVLYFMEPQNWPSRFIYCDEQFSF